MDANLDENLRVEINCAKFRGIPPKKNIQLFNVPPTFNGLKLRGHKKTLIFLTILAEGEHFINLIPKNSAFIEEIKIQELSGTQNVDLQIDDKPEILGTLYNIKDVDEPISPHDNPEANRFGIGVKNNFNFSIDLAYNLSINQQIFSQIYK